jgi:serine/threonine protein kinase
MNPTPGARIGPYEIVSPLGAGGRGGVFRARDTRLKRKVASRFCRKRLPSIPAGLRRSEQEAPANAALNHPHILAVFDIGVRARD